ncbi:VRR-NUC domain-containing protein [Pseudoalteromonas sp. SMS1]|uniref:exonuclease domain-containing protein n=1 Tax=Pseudoalteromonas sp. SMS1 TaxID=2908894 RepID=UPI001F1AF53B|nr:exonuclease domain-containing protein [Pseudoalteromonas sp. SMS1]MCF2857021.1 VRR-NUC domain-containing protein [Pseudoalteromonas sp. SMS1]
MKTLPEKYYLTHFFELVSYIEQTSLHLLSDEQRAKLAAFKRLDEQSQCLLVRVINRKREYVCRADLEYSEITDYDAAFNTLYDEKWLSLAAEAQTPQSLLAELNKAQLQTLATKHDLACPPVKSAKKSVWLAFVAGKFTLLNLSDCDLYTHYFTSHFKQDFTYLLFLYFGKSGGALAQFSMRDLGVMQTNAERAQTNAHFDDYQEAQSAFYFSRLYAELKQMSEQEMVATARVLTDESVMQPVGQLAQVKFDHLCFKLANRVAELNGDLSEALLVQSAHPSAQEKYIRLLYSQGEHTRCKQQIEQILDAPSDEQLLFFAEDFYRLKYTSKRTSALTDVLRNSGPKVSLDEAYKGDVEQGLVNHYARQGINAVHCENMLWRTLFCLSFWYELFEDHRNAFSNEFESTPKCIKENTFYRVFETEIERRLSTFDSNDELLSWLVKQASTHFGTHCRLLHWQPEVLTNVFEFAKQAPVQAVCAHLRAMSKDFKNLKDGYPDLMVFDDGVKFVEVKAPGDSLRRNQLITIQTLIRHGFDVDVQSVEWRVDPQQPYVIVDIETTGGKKEHDKITEIAMIKVQGGDIVEEWQSLINPQRRVPKYITELTGIDNNMVVDSPIFSDIMDKIDAFTKDAIFVAHNVNFDFGFIKAEFARLDRPFRRAKLCTVQLGRKWLPGHASYSLGKICQDLSIPLQGHHRAYNDAAATVALFHLINQKRIEAASE